jgi:hypothetical protein
MLSVGIFGYAIWHWLLQLQALHLFVFLPLNAADRASAETADPCAA